MPYPVQRYNRTLNRFCIATKAFTDDEVDKIIDLEDLQKYQKGAVGSVDAGSKVSKKTRDSDVQWIMHDPQSDWLYRKFSMITSQINYDHFMFDIDGFESFQYTKYSAKEKQHYDWHIDSGNTSAPFERKISATIMLTEPKKYTGGEFQVVLDGQVEKPQTMKLERGDIVFFASYFPHRVCPITEGIRRSLVCWVMGKNQW